jgi:pimeloyl-ACP methyl ester carboxylesterase
MKASARPRADATITLADGRILAHCEWGEPTGSPVLLAHGPPGSRLLCPDEDATVGAGVRLLTVDRPGYGCSDARPDPSLLGWADDVQALADQLGLDRFAVVGFSAGVAMRWPVRPGCPSASAQSAWPAVRVPTTRCRMPGRRT